MSQDADAFYAQTWTTLQLGEALEITARRARLLAQPVTAPRPPAELELAAPETLERWVLMAADCLGIEAEPVMATPGQLVALVQNVAPALLRLPPRPGEDSAQSEPPRFLPLVRGGERPLILGADLQLRRADPQQLADALSAPLIAPYLSHADMLLEAVGVPTKRRPHTRRLIIEQQLGNVPLPCGWLLRLSPGDKLAHQARQSRLWLTLLELVAAQALQLALLVVTWWFIGRMTLAGGGASGEMMNQGWMQAWALVLFTTIPVQLWLSGAQSRFATSLGLLFRQRMLFGTLQLRPDEIRHQGMGQFLERVMMAEQVEMLAVGGGLLAVLAVFQLLVAIQVLALGAGGIIQALTLVIYLVLAAALAWHYYRTNHLWVGAYRQMTNDLVERMVGHRTRLAQQDPREWHTHEDAELERYFDLSERFDGSTVMIDALPRLWVVVGTAGLVPAFVMGEPSAPGIAVGLGGVMLALNALTTISQGLNSLVNVGTAWDQVGPIFHAAARHQPISAVALEQAARSAAFHAGDPIVRARNVTYRYREHGRAALREVNLDVYAGDRVLLEGPSGGGKTTLAAVLAGLRVPEAGLVFVRGLERQSVESQVTPRRVAMAPQFHENYVFSATLAFNLLMGRRWPAREDDIAEAEALCRALGLGDLLARMPSGMSQMVGDNGWQLSHGERSRIYIARVLLQNADLVILDESFGALDPENLQRALQTTLDRAPTLIVIAHP